MLFSWCRIEVDGYIVEGEAGTQNNSGTSRADWGRVAFEADLDIKASLERRPRVHVVAADGKNKQNPVPMGQQLRPELEMQHRIEGRGLPRPAYETLVIGKGLTVGLLGGEIHRT